MWADAKYWLKKCLGGELAVPFRGRFHFKGHEGEDESVLRDARLEGGGF